MVLLAQAPINTLKEIPSQLWAKAVESPKHVAYVFEVIGSVKTFHEKDVCLFFSFFLRYSKIKIKGTFNFERNLQRSFINSHIQKTTRNISCYCR